jgi:hypothetical protein
MPQLPIFNKCKVDENSKKYSTLCVKYLKPTVITITTETNAGQYTLSANNIHYALYSHVTTT